MASGRNVILLVTLLFPLVALLLLLLVASAHALSEQAATTTTTTHEEAELLVQQAAGHLEQQQQQDGDAHPGQHHRHLSSFFFFFPSSTNPRTTSGTSMAGVVVGIVAVAAAAAISLHGRHRRRSTTKLRGVRVPDSLLDPPPEPSVTYRNARFLSLVEDADGAGTIPALLDAACARHAARPMLGTRAVVARETERAPDGRTLDKVHLGGYAWQTYAEVRERVRCVAGGLAALGHAPGERVAIFAETRAEWLIAAHACFARAAPVVTIYASLGDEALVWSLNETEVGTVVCDAKQLAKVVAMGGKLKTVRRVVYMAEDTGPGGGDGGVGEQAGRGRGMGWVVEPFARVEELGRGGGKEGVAAAAAAQQVVQPGDVAVIMYTSGSTGMPKGVMMTHRNIVSSIGGIGFLVPHLGASDVYIAYLPLAHVMELAAELTVTASGGAIGFGSPLTLTDTSSKIKRGTRGDAAALRPTLMTAVPAILDRVRDGVRKQVDSAAGLKKALFNLAYTRRLAAIEGSPFGARGPERLLYDLLVFRKIRLVLGGRVRGLLSGGAPLSRDTQRFINVTFGAPIGQGYGLTETCAGGTFSEWDDPTVGRVGPPVPHALVRLVDWPEGGYRTTDAPAPRGEILIGGPCVTLGYFRNPDKTESEFWTDARGIRWFRTGDVGAVHPDGCLEIVDRKKDMVKLQHGEYVSLGKVEAALAGCPYLDTVMVHADPAHAFAVALGVASHPALEEWARRQGVAFRDVRELCGKREAVEEVLRSVNGVARQAKLHKFEVPARVKLLPDAWTAESGLVTAALKLKRESIRKAFAAELQELYA